MRRWAWALLSGAAALACGSDASNAPPPSPCAAFPKPPEPKLRIVLGRSAAVTRVFAGAGRTYALLDTGAVAGIAKDASGVDVAVETKSKVLDAAVSKDARLFVARSARGATAGSATIEIVRWSSWNGGAKFDAASEKVLFAIDGVSNDDVASLAFGADGSLFVAVGDLAVGLGNAAQDPSSLRGKVLRIDVSGDGWASPPGNPFEKGGGRPEIYALGVRKPTLDVDPSTGDVWLFDRGPDVDEVDRVYPGRNFGWPTRQGARCAPPATTCQAEGFEDGVVELGDASHPRIPDGSFPSVSRSAYADGIASAIVYRAPSGLVAIDPFGPSGPPNVTVHPLDAPPSMRVVGRTADGDVAVADGESLAFLYDDAKSTAPRRLSETKCFDVTTNGPPEGGIAYDVDVALWSDGATKQRVAFVPAGQKVHVKPDGDLVFPVGTVLVKTFSIGGKRVETRLLVQHALEDWAGYSYRWKEDQSDAELVVGNRRDDLGGGKSWYFPSRADCSACHTPAAGYALGPEARQLGKSAAAFDPALDAPLDRAKYAPPLSPLDGSGTTDEKARSYLHANCSVCHRDGSATGLAELDLRVDVPLAKTGVCGPPKTSSLGFTDAKIVAPGEPVRSTLLARMRALDDRRMPKLASHVVDDAGVALIEVWIKEMRGCQ
jgi:uncharacterized repeat protein (TIGR03806 family)